MNKKNINIKENFNLGLQNFKKNNFKDAENYFKVVLNNDPDHLKSIFFLGILRYTDMKIFQLKAGFCFLQIIKVLS